MTVNEGDDATERAAASPWAGDVPIPAAPVEFQWSTPDANAPVQPDEPGQSDRPAPPDRRRWAFGAVAAVLLLVMGWLVAGRDGDDSSDAALPATSAEPGTDTAPDDSLPTIDDEPDVVEPDTTLPSGPTDTGSSGEAGVPEWVSATIEIPPRLQQGSEPYELVVLTNDSRYVEIAVPSGTTSTFDLGAPTLGEVVAGTPASLLTTYSGADPEGRLIEVDALPREVALPDNTDGMQAVGTSGRFVGWAYGNDALPDRVEIDADGSVVLSPSALTAGNFWQERFLSDGSTLIAEAGGVYRGVGISFSRVSTGTLLAASDRHVVVRDCDDAMRCGFFSVDLSTGERIELPIDIVGLSQFGFGEPVLSPDGRWMWFVAYPGNSVEDVLIDLSTGDEVQRSAFDGRPTSIVWLPDSSGFIRQANSAGLEFYDVTTGERIEFAGDLGVIQSFDVRRGGAVEVIDGAATTTTGVGLIGLTETGEVVGIDVDSATVVSSDGVFFSTAASGSFLPGPFTDTMWQVVEGADDATLAFELVDLIGNGVGARISTDAADVDGIVGSDGSGGVVVEVELGGLYVLDASSQIERITSGELLGINAQTSFVRECDDALECGVFRVDRVTGERVAIELPGGDRVGDIGSRAVPSGRNVSPDGQMLFARDAQSPADAMMIDLAAETWTGVPPVDRWTEVFWTPDYAIWLADGRVRVYERSTSSLRTINSAALQAIRAADQSS